MQGNRMHKSGGLLFPAKRPHPYPRQNHCAATLCQAHFPGASGYQRRPCRRPADLYQQLSALQRSRQAGFLVYSHAHPAGKLVLRSNYNVDHGLSPGLFSGARNFLYLCQQPVFAGPSQRQYHSVSPANATRWGIVEHSTEQETSRSPWVVGSNLVL